MTADEIERAEQLLGHKFSDRDLLQRAVTHASLVDSRLDSNERLEFLGDAVLGIVVCDYLFKNFADLLEGEMTKIKSTVVSGACCAAVAEAMGLAELLRLGKGMSNRPTLPLSVVAAVYEGIIGAIYIDAGLEAARAFILRFMEERIHDASRSGHQYNFKSVLQQAAQQVLTQTPQYVILDEKGPDHAKCFEVCVDIGSRRFESCWEPSKKQAEQQAALEALLELGFAERMKNGEVRLLDIDSVAPADGRRPPKPGHARGRDVRAVHERDDRRRRGERFAATRLVLHDGDDHVRVEGAHAEEPGGAHHARAALR